MPAPSRNSTYRTSCSLTTISQAVAGQEMVWPRPSHMIMMVRYESQQVRQNKCPHSNPLISLSGNDSIQISQMYSLPELAAAPPVDVCWAYRGNKTREGEREGEREGGRGGTVMTTFLSSCEASINFLSWCVQII